MVWVFDRDLWYLSGYSGGDQRSKSKEDGSKEFDTCRGRGGLDG
jgi:hypothetical protein